MFAAILSAITALFSAIPQLIRLFTRAPQSKKEDIDRAVDADEKRAKDTGRP